MWTTAFDLMSKGSHKEAIALCNELIDSQGFGSPDYLKFRYILGVSQAALNQHAEAIATFEHILGININLPDVFNRYFQSLCELGKQETELGLLREASKHFERAALIRPDMDLSGLQRQIIRQRLTPTSHGTGFAGFDLKRLEAIDAWLEQSVAQGRLNGAALRIEKGDHLIKEVFVGTMDAAAQTPWKADTICSIMSMSKPLVSAATLMLIDEGKLALEDSIERWVPELSEMMVLRSPSAALDDVEPAQRQITILDLLTHRAGFAYSSVGGNIGTALLAVDPVVHNEMGTMDQWLSTLAQFPLLFQPGSHYKYGLSTDVLGIVIARLSGMSLGQLLRQKLFDPLDMPDTSFVINPLHQDRQAAIFRPNAERKLMLTESPGQHWWRSADRFESGGAGLLSTLEDYSHFSQMMLNRGRYNDRQLLSRYAVSLMTRNWVDEAQRRAVPTPDGQGYGFGVYVADRPENMDRNGRFSTVGRYGWGGGAGTMWWVEPAENLSFVFMSQVGDGLDDNVADLTWLLYQAMLQ